MELTFELEADRAIRAMTLAPTRTQRGVRRALNRALTTGRAEMARRVGKEFGMSVGDAKEAIFVEQATDQNLQVRLVASRRRRPLFEFQARQTGAGVTFKGQSGRQLVPGAFIAIVRAGKTGTHEGVFKRRGKKRLPIHELFGVSIGEVFNRHRPAVSQVMQAAFDKNLASELKFAEGENA